MNVIKKVMIFERFQFLKSVLNEDVFREELSIEDIDEISLSKITDDLMHMKGDVDEYDWSGGHRFDYSIYLAVLKDNSVIPLEYSYKYENGSGEKKEWTVPTIGEQLLLKHVSPVYILMCQKSGPDWDNERRYINWVIYKTNPSFDQMEYLLTGVDIAAAALKAEIKAMFPIK